MSLILVHLSDIHFGQEKKDKLVFVHEDARERLLDDARKFAVAIAPKRIAGVIVTGDIAYAGTTAEYIAAGKWLDRLTEILGCGRSHVQVIPGNHDIDRSQISAAAEYLLTEIETKGEDRLNELLHSESDRELLYRRFHAYEVFADAYNCPLDRNGGGAGDRVVELAPGRRLRFSGLNTALACSKNDVEGQLLLGERQRVLQRNSGEELVVLAHHPMRWMADEKDANEYIRARARVLVTGHEHSPSAVVENVFEGADLLTIAAGATTPPETDDDFTYTYNFLEFGWDQEHDALAVDIHPRCWSEERKEFGEDKERIATDAKSCVLGSPRYREAPRVELAQVAALVATTDPPVIQQETSNEDNGTDLMPAEYPDIVLRFFRDLAAGQRLKLLVDVGAVPADWNDTLSHGYEKMLLDRAIQTGKAVAIRTQIDEMTSAAKTEEEGQNG